MQIKATYICMYDSTVVKKNFLKTFFKKEIGNRAKIIV